MNNHIVLQYLFQVRGCKDDRIRGAFHNHLLMAPCDHIVNHKKLLPENFYIRRYAERKRRQGGFFRKTYVDKRENVPCVLNFRAVTPATD